MSLYDWRKVMKQIVALRVQSLSNPYSAVSEIKIWSQIELIYLKTKEIIWGIFIYFYLLSYELSRGIIYLMV